MDVTEPRLRPIPDLTADKLNRLREKQGIDGPNYCFAAAKFFAGKLAGLYGPRKHLSDFIASPWYKTHRQQNRVFKSWASPIRPHPDYFNEHVIRPTVLLDEAGIKTGTPSREPYQFGLFRSPSFAEGLLRSRVPVVAAVDLKHAKTGGWGGQDHYVTLVMDARHRIWIVDPWERDSDESVREIKSNTLSRKTTLTMNAGTTTLPPNRPYFGYFYAQYSPARCKIHI